MFFLFSFRSRRFIDPALSLGVDLFNSSTEEEMGMAI